MISIIAAIGKNNELGKNNDLIWHLPNDLKFFKEQTINQTIVMGYNTFVSLGRVLPKRTHIVLSYEKVRLPDEVIQFNNLDDLNKYIKDKDVFIIGGASLYQQFINKADRLYLTEIDDTSKADVYFPKFDKSKYNKIILGENSDNGINYRHVLYEKKKGKIIVIEGTDCSGKETQSKKVIENLKEYNFKYFAFPNYDSPTGKIIAGPYLGKETVCEGWFPEGAANVSFKIASLYYAADRKYNIDKINEMLNEGYNVILDRYTYSNMAHQAGKVKDKKERLKTYKWIEKLEFDFLELPKPDLKIFLHVPYEVSLEIRKNRKEKFDQLESNHEHLINAEKAYLELVDLYGFEKIECSKNGKMLSVDEINKKICKYIKSNLKPE